MLHGPLGLSGLSPAMNGKKRSPGGPWGLYMAGLQIEKELQTKRIEFYCAFQSG